MFNSGPFLQFQSYSLYTNFCWSYFYRPLYKVFDIDLGSRVTQPPTLFLMEKEFSNKSSLTYTAECPAWVQISSIITFILAGKKSKSVLAKTDRHSLFEFNK